MSNCSLPRPTTGDQPPDDATEHLGQVSFWPCPTHGSHAGRRRSLTWSRGWQQFGWWEWVVCDPSQEMAVSVDGDPS